MGKTKASLHNALIGLAREKPYPAIAVKEILDRANVGKSTFYMHFRDKDDLLESGIHDILASLHDRPRSGNVSDRILAFSLPLLEHIDDHRRGAGPKMKREGRAIMHEHMQHVLTALIADELAQTTGTGPNTEIPPALVAHHVASTFVLVLNWWVESEPALTPQDVNAYFRALIGPTLAKFSTQLG